MADGGEDRNALIARMLETMSDACVVLDRAWFYTYVNRRAGELFGRAPQDLVGKHIWTEFPEGVGQPFHDAYVASMADRRPRQIEAYYPPWKRWFENRICPAEDGIAIFFTDITARKEAEMAARELAASREQAEKMAHLGFWHWTVGVDRVTWSEGLHRIFEVDRDTFGGTFAAYLERVHPDDQARVRSIVTHALVTRGSASFEERIVRPVGDVRHLHSWACVSVDHKGDVDGMFGTCLDLTELVETSAHLRRSEEWLLRALDAAKVGLWDWDIGSQKVLWSPGVEALFGLPPGAFGHSFEGFMELVEASDRGAVQASVDVSLATGGEHRVEFRVRRQDGALRWIAARGSPLRDGRGRVVRLLGSVVDVTAVREADEERRRSKEALRHAEKLDAIGRLGAGVAHDLKNFLAVVDLSATLLARKVTDDAALGALVGDIQGAVARASALTRQLLAVGAHQAPRLAAHDLREVVESMAGLLRAATPPPIRLETSLSSAPVFADRAQLEQVVLNLVMNARDAMPRGGELRVETRAAGDEVTLVVSDTGVGMPPDVRARAFDPFYSTKPDGSGVGLSTVQDVAAQSRGRVELDSEVGRGTTVRVILPRA